MTQIHMVGVLLATLGLNTLGFAQSGGSISCNPPVGARATWYDSVDSQSLHVRGIVEPDYTFGSVPVIYGNTYAPTSGVEAVGDYVDIPLSYPFQGTNYSLKGAYCWFEFGHWDNYNTYWTQVSSSPWCYYSFAGGGCFVAGTPVATQDSSKPIEQLKKGDYVLTVSEKSVDSQPELGQVKEVVRRVSKTLDVQINGHTVGVTKGHPFFVMGRAWTPAESLQPGDFLKSSENDRVVVQSIANAGEVPVFDLRVENDSFFVGGKDLGFSVLVYGACHKDPRRPVATATTPNLVLTDFRGGRRILAPKGWKE